MIKVVRGNPTPEELAAALAVVQARAAATAAVSSGATAAARAVVRPGPDRPAGPASSGSAVLGTDVLARLALGGPTRPSVRTEQARRPGPLGDRASAVSPRSDPVRTHQRG